VHGSSPAAPKQRLAARAKGAFFDGLRLSGSGVCNFNQSRWVVFGYSLLIPVSECDAYSLPGKLQILDVIYRIRRERII